MSAGITPESQRNPGGDPTGRREGAWGPHGVRVLHPLGGLGASGVASGDGLNHERIPLLIDSREVARILGLGRTTVFQMMARSELPVVRLGRSVRVPRGALIAWVADRTEGGVDSLASGT